MIAYLQLPQYVIFNTSSTSLSTATCTCNYDAKNGLYCVGTIRDAVSSAYAFELKFNMSRHFIVF